MNISYFIIKRPPSREQYVHTAHALVRVSSLAFCGFFLCSYSPAKKQVLPTIHKQNYTTLATHFRLGVRLSQNMRYGGAGTYDTTSLLREWQEQSLGLLQKQVIYPPGVNLSDNQIMEGKNHTRAVEMKHINTLCWLL